MPPARRLWLLFLLTLAAGAIWPFFCLRTAAGPAPPPPTDRPALIGQVRDARGPVEGARVRLKGREPSVLTDSRGCFRLPALDQPAARVTAWKAGFLIAGAPADSSPLVLTLEPLPAEDDEEYSWVDPAPDTSRPQNCGNCHGDIYREWAASGHARSAGGRHFLNLYDGSDWRGRQNVGWNLLADRPEGAGVCNACHAPTAEFDADLRDPPGLAGRGVHCDYCHKVEAADNDHIGLTHGRFGMRLLRPSKGQLFFGPLDDVDRREDAFAPVYRDSRYCASCHEGIVFGVHAYGTYSEWLESPARKEGKQCQSCHMKPTGKLANIAPGKGGIPRDPHTLANHLFFAGSQEEMLRQALKVEALLSAAGGDVRAEVRVSVGEVGHRLPTGFPDRNLVLLVEGQDGHGRGVPHRSGPVLPEAAGVGFAGRPGRLYARRLKDAEGHSPVPFWRADPEAEDSRLSPGRPDRLEVHFPAAVEQVRIALVYRRFWPEVARSKGWPDNEVPLIDTVVALQGATPVRWSSLP